MAIIANGAAKVTNRDLVPGFQRCATIDALPIYLRPVSRLQIFKNQVSRLGNAQSAMLTACTVNF